MRTDPLPGLELVAGPLSSGAVLAADLVAGRGVRPLVRDRGSYWGTDRLLLSASFFLKGYASRLVGLHARTWLASEQSLVLLPDRVHLEFDQGLPTRCWLSAPSAVVSEDRVADVVEGQLVGGHLLPLADRLRSSAGGGRGWWRGNVAAAVVGAYLDAGDLWPARCNTVARIASDLLRAPELEGLGTLCTDGPLTHYRRSHCCLYYLVEPVLCADCSRSDPEPRSGGSQAPGI